MTGASGMTGGAGMTAVIAPGARLVWDGELFCVTAVEADRVVLAGGGRQVSAHLAGMLAGPGVRFLVPSGPGAVGPETGGLDAGGLDAGGVPALGPVLDSLTGQERRDMHWRLGHVRELLTGYAAGSAGVAGSGEPREEYAPTRPVADRFASKAVELGVAVRTLRRWAAAFELEGPAGLVDRRGTRTANPFGRVDERWLSMCRTVLGEHTDASRPTKDLLLRRVSARLAAEHGPGVVPEPGRNRARAVLAELARGTNAFVGSTKGKRSIAGRPQGVYGRLAPMRPGEYLLLDTTTLDVFAMEPVTLRWVRLELTVAMDLYSRCICGLRLSPVSTKSQDAAAVLFEALHPDTSGTSSAGLLAYVGLPDLVVINAERTVEATADVTGTDSTAGVAGLAGAAGLPGVAAETVVVDHGKIYLSAHMLSVCQRLGVSVQPARPLTPTDKAAIERFFRTLREQLLAALPGYKGPDVFSRGKNAEETSYFFTDELERIIREWVGRIYHQSPHEGLVEPQVPGLALSPREMLAHGVARAGRLRVPARAGLVWDFLPVAWRTIQHYGVEVNGLRYNGPGLTPYRNRTSPFTGAHAGKWPLRYSVDDISRIYFQDPADSAWYTLAWEHAQEVAAPFSADTLAFARKLVLADGRHVQDRAALAELLSRWDAGLVRHPAERRMAIRASQVRAADIAKTTPRQDPAEVCADVAALPSVVALRDAEASVPQPHRRLAEQISDDDLDEDLDDPACDEAFSEAGSDEDFYAGALEVLR